MNKILIILILIISLSSIINMLDKLTDVLIEKQSKAIVNPKVINVKDI